LFVIILLRFTAIPLEQETLIMVRNPPKLFFPVICSGKSSLREFGPIIKVSSAKGITGKPKEIGKIRADFFDDCSDS
jgi:hypothetical protein